MSCPEAAVSDGDVHDATIEGIEVVSARRGWSIVRIGELGNRHLHARGDRCAQWIRDGDETESGRVVGLDQDDRGTSAGHLRDLVGTTGQQEVHEGKVTTIERTGRIVGTKQRSPEATARAFLTEEVVGDVPALGIEAEARVVHPVGRVLDLGQGPGSILVPEAVGVLVVTDRDGDPRLVRVVLECENHVALPEQVVEALGSKVKSLPELLEEAGSPLESRRCWKIGVPSFSYQAISMFTVDRVRDQPRCRSPAGPGRLDDSRKEDRGLGIDPGTPVRPPALNRWACRGGGSCPASAWEESRRDAWSLPPGPRWMT